ncbi:MAG: PAS domain S-box protein, partial [Ramlibacter sp.]
MSEPPAIVGQFGEAALQALIDQAPDGIFVADIDGRYTYVNEAGCRMLGYSRDEVLRMKIEDTVLTRDPSRLDRAKAVMLAGRSEAAEWTLRRKDGTALPVEVNARILSSGQWHGFVRNVAERKAHEAEREALFERIETERRRLQTLVDTLPLSVLLFGPGGTVTGNRRVEELLGMKLTAAAGSAQYVGRIFYPDGRPVPREHLVASRVMRGETVIGVEQLVRRPDGSQVPTLGSAAPILDDEGRIVGGVAVFQDISERMRLEQAVQANERLLLTVFDLLPVGIWITDEHGRVTRGNPAGRQLWQGSPDARSEQEGEFKGWWVETGKPIAPGEWAIVRAVRNGETSRRELIRIQCFDGSFKTVINWATPLRSAEGKIIGAIAVNEDITALHQTQEQLRTAVRDREDILAVVTHDLRSPLSAIMTVAATLQLKARALAGGEPVRAMAATLVDIGRQMSGLVSDLLAVALARTDRS